MKRLMIIALVIGLLSGCQTKNDQNIQAHQRWSGARAAIVCSLAEEHLKAGDLEKARDAALRSIQLDQNNLQARILLAKVLVEQGQYAVAIAELRIAEILAQDNAEVTYLLGVAQEKRGEYVEALKHYSRARALDPSQDAYVAASAEVLTTMGKPAQGLELLEARLDRGDVSPLLQALAGELAMLVGRYDQAVQFYRHCLDADPQDPLAREGIAKAYYFARRYTHALKALEELAAEPPYRARTLWVYLMIGDSHMALQRPSKARDAYQTAIRIDPDSAPVWKALGRACLTLGDVNGASAAARKALILGGDSLEAAVVLAYGMMCRGKLDQAAAILDDQARKHPDDPTVLCMLGQCYQRMGRKDRATSCYQKVLRAQPQHPLARTLLSAVELK